MITQPPGLLTEEDRELLREQGMELTPSPDRRLNRELTMAYDAVALPQQAAVPQLASEPGGRQVRPAAFVEQLMGLLPAVTVEKPEVGSCPPAPLPALDWADERGPMTCWLLWNRRQSGICGPAGWRRRNSISGAA